MELVGYVVEWSWLIEEYSDPSLREPDHLFRLMDQGSQKVFSPGPLVDERSASYSDDIGSLFVELVEEDVLAPDAGRDLGSLFVMCCPALTEIDGLTPPIDIELGDVFYAVASPNTLRERLRSATDAKHVVLREALQGLIQERSDASPTLQETMDYFALWRGVMADAASKDQGLLVTLC